MDTQSGFTKWVYEGKDFTMIFCNPHVDGMIWFSTDDNKNELITPGQSSQP